MNYEELIDNYFAGNISSEESKALLDEVAKNPQLQEEFNFQKELTSSIKNARKAELKASLASLPVPKLYNPTPLYWGAAAIVGIIFTGIYFFNSTENHSTALKTPTEELVILKEESKSNELTEANTKEELIETLTEETISTTSEKTKEPEEIIVHTEVNSKPSVEKKEKEATNKPAAKKAFHYDIKDPSVNPAIGEFDDVLENTDINAPSNNLTSTTKDNKVSEIVPKIEVNNKSYRKYQYDGQNLTLVGDFNSDVPYVLYELKLNTEKQLYLKFENQYYAIKNTGSKTNKLETLTDQVVINELENK